MEDKDNNRVNQLLELTPANVDEGMAWLGDVWQYFLDTGLYFAGGPADPTTSLRLKLIERAREHAKRLDSREVSAEANRITAHVLNASERYVEATTFYEQAVTELRSLGREEVAARTSLGYSAALMMSGSYARALEVCDSADRWFMEKGDAQGHARVLINTGNTYHRLDAHAKALACQLEAAEIFKEHGNGNDLAATSLNIANSYAFLDQFERSDQMYQQAEEVAADLGLSALADQARYNRAYLFFLRGRYSDAIVSFNSLRKHFETVASVRHAALCDLDQGEIYLQLNMPTDAAVLSENARHAFHDLGMAYEEAKAIAFLGVAQTQQRHYQDALNLFAEAEPLFAKEDNAFWIGMIELYRAEVLLALGRYWEAKSLGESALARYETMDVPYQTGMALIILGQAGMATGMYEDTRKLSERLIKLIDASQAPLLKFPAHMLCAHIAEASDDPAQARQHYESAAESIEQHRTYLHHDELRVRFLEGKHQVYEALVRFALMDKDYSTAFAWCERAKARALSDLLGQHLPAVRSEANPELLNQIHQLRDELNSHYVRSRPEGGEFAAPVPQSDLDRTERELEQRISQLSVVDERFGSLFGITPGSLEDAQRVLPPDTTLVEFFVTAGEVVALVVTATGITAFRQLTSIEKIQQLRQGLDFQMQKFALGTDYITNHHAQMLATTTQYLQRLYNELARKWVDSIETRNLVVIPHGELHALPFHALFDGEGYLMDRFRISYAPSAEVLRHTLNLPRHPGGPGLLVGRPDAAAPAIADEIAHLRRLSPDSVVLVDDAAIRDRLFESAGDARFIHIATHAFFRRDNPMFSGFQLADGPVTALDLYSKAWRADLVTLSGCSSGVAEVTGGDDLMGLVRGLLHAGARTLLMSLWNVSDEATVLLTEAFYQDWLKHGDKLQALENAMLVVRKQYPHPFYWAPFVLVGAP